MKIPIWSGLSSRARKWVGWGGGLVLFYTIFGFLILPVLVRHMGAKQLTKALDRPVTIRKVRINPYHLSASILGLSIQDKDGETLAKWEEVYANFQLSSIYSGGWDFREVRLESPFARVQIDAQGRLNFSDLLTQTNAAETAPASGKTRPLRVGEIRLRDGRVSFKDLARARPFSRVVGPFSVDLAGFNTGSGESNTVSFQGVTESGESIAVNSRFQLDPLSVEGTLTLEGLTLPRLAPYYHHRIGLEIKDGTLDLRVGYRAAFGAETSLVQVTNLALSLKSFALGREGVEKRDFALGELRLEGGWLDLFGQTGGVESLGLRQGKLQVERARDGVLNLATLFAPAGPAPNQPAVTTPVQQEKTSAAAEAKPIQAPDWKIRLGRFEVADWTVDYSDASLERPVAVRMDALNLALTNVTTLPGERAGLALELTWNTNGLIKTSGTFELFPPAADLTLALEQLSLTQTDHYLDPFLNLLLKKGHLALDGTVQFRSQTGKPADVVFQGNLSVADFLAHQSPGDEKLAAWDRLALRGIQVDTEPMTVSIGEIVLDGLQTRFEHAGSSNNFTGLAKTPPAAPQTKTGEASQTGEAAAQTKNSQPPPVRIGAVTLTNTALVFVDRTTPRPVQVSLENLFLQLQRLSNQPEEKSGWILATQLNTNTWLRSTGAFGLFPPTAVAHINLTNLALPEVEPYVTPSLDLALARGWLDVLGTVKIDLPTNAAPALAFQGDVNVRELATTDGLWNEPLLNMTNLALNGIQFDLAPPRLTLDRIDLDDFLFRFILATNGNTLAAVLRTSGPPKETTSAPEPKADQAPPPPQDPSKPKSTTPPLALTLRHVTWTNVNLEIQDRIIQPKMALGLYEMEGSVTNLSSEPPGSGDISLRGKVDRTAPFEVAGRLAVLGPEMNTDLKVKFEHVSMAPFEPYLTTYVGHRLSQGWINFNLETRLQGRQLDTKNLIVLDRFNLGSAVDSASAIKAPVKLALALLKDQNGQIQLDIPVAGSLDDPNFRYAPFLWRTINNLILKAATSPFSLLGSLTSSLPGLSELKAEELAFQDFLPGSTQLAEKNRRKLEGLAQVLQKRPGLSLGITGSYDPVEDPKSLRRLALDKQLRTLKWEETRLAGQTNLALETVSVPTEEFPRLLRLAYLKQLDTNQPVHVEQAAAPVPQEQPTAPQTNAPPQTPLPSPGPAAPAKRWGAKEIIKGAPLLVLRSPKKAGDETKPAELAEATPTPPTPPEPAQAELPPPTTPPESVPQVSPEEMEKALLEKIEITAAELDQLAGQRADRVKEFLGTEGKINLDRLIAEPAREPQLLQRGPRVYLELR